MEYLIGNTRVHEKPGTVVGKNFIIIKITR